MKFKFELNMNLWQSKQRKYNLFTFPAHYYTPKKFSSANSNCFNLLDMRNCQEQVEKAFSYQNLFWPFTVLINCSSDFKIFFSITRTIFSQVDQNNFGNKIPFLFITMLVLAQICMLCIAKIEIVHCKTYTKWLCFQRPDFWPWHQGQVQYKVFYCTSCLQGILFFFHFLFTNQIENCSPDFFVTILIIINIGFQKYEIWMKYKIWVHSNQNSNFEIQSRKENKFLI